MMDKESIANKLYGKKYNQLCWRRQMVVDCYIDENKRVENDKQK